MTAWTKVARKDDLGEDRAMRVTIDGALVCLARSDGEFYALSDRCSHAEIALSEGEVEDGKVECWLHGSQFDLRTGEPLGLPATIAVTTYPVRVEGDDVYVSVRE